MTDRHSRQIRCAGIGAKGQARIRAGSVLIVGVGALGTHAADTLVRAGVGRVVLVDRDVVETSNLQRQVLFDEADAEQQRAKAIAAADRLRKIDSSCEIVAVPDEFDADTFDGLDCPDVIVDGTDNFATRLLINDLAVRAERPWIYGAAVATTGRAAVIAPPDTPCLRCLLPEPPPGAELETCETAGILASTIAQVAAFQATEALRLLVGESPPTRGVLVLDTWNPRFELRLQDVRPDPDCPTCGHREFPSLDTDRERYSISLCGRDAVQVRPRGDQSIDLERVAAHLRAGDTEVDERDRMLRFAADGCRFTVFRGGRTLIFGTRDERRARALYDRYVGA